MTPRPRPPAARLRGLFTSLALALPALATTLTTPGLARAAAPEPTVTRRIALIVGANDGGTSRVKLRYAGSDARALSRVLAEVGGLTRNDQQILLDPSQADLLAAFARAQTRV